ncbi:MAG: ATP-dependent DNA helicase RecG [Chlorobia bacterium]|nr:ATP-dependent DNA helicase RecG [Fimbriimonadaceae bacterium]
MTERSLNSEAQWLKGVGPKVAPLFAKLGLYTVGDVLYHLPRRYEDRTKIPPIKMIRPGQHVTIRGNLRSVSSRPISGGRVIVKAIVDDPTGTVALTWFNQPWIARKLDQYKGEVVAYGLAKEAEFGCEISAPEYELIEDEEDAADFARIIPVYPSTEGLVQKILRRAARAAVEGYLGYAVDPLPPSILKAEMLRPLRWSLREIHEPASDANRLEARKRLVFEEFFYLQVSLAMKRAETQQELGIAFPIQALKEGVLALRHSGIAESPNVETPKNRKAALVVKERRSSHLFEADQEAKREGIPIWDQIHKMLPFELTGAQRRVIEEIWSDMEQPHPMNRLVQGDVGSGKTAVAACTMLAAVRSGYQAALMAPTEILAEQHFATFGKLFEPLGIEVALLVGKQNSRERKKALQLTESGQAKIAIGTHAIIQEGVTFDRLGLAVVDEQHRFGVLQRAALRQKGLGNPDVLVMTATPIPRTLTMTLYGDLELSVIDELPPGRRSIKTHYKPGANRTTVYEGVRKLVEEGRQAYFVCPMVSESEKMQAQAATDLAYRLESGVFKDLRVGLLHGQMKSSEKEDVMNRFRRHELDILVSTTVIEVGVDVPNASVMVIEDANRFGLSQLHQLRGRVGRGDHQSYCILIADARNEDARERMDTMVETTDGFEIAEVDLRLRGPGELAGTAQSGNRDFKIADLVQDGKLLEVARQAALKLIEKDPTLVLPENQGILAKVQERRSQTAVITVS